MKAIVLAIMLAFSTAALAGPGYYLIATATANAANAATVKKQDVKKVPAKKAPAKKKEDGKIKPLEEGRKVPTLKKKYKKD
jgi:hypothetical protein